MNSVLKDLLLKGDPQMANWSDRRSNVLQVNKMYNQALRSGGLFPPFPLDGRSF